MILFISTNVKKDGAEKSLVALQAYLNNVEKIDTMVIIPSHGEIEELLIENGVKYKIFSFVGSVNFGRGTKLLRGFSKMLINRIAAIKLKRLLKKENIDVIGVHSNTITTDFGHYLALSLGVPHIWHIREFGKLDFNFDFELGMKYISRCANKSAKIVCNSKAVADYYSQYFNKGLITYVHNGIPIKEKPENSWSDSKFKIILIGRLSKEKGHDIALEACKMLNDNSHSDFIIDLYGSGDDEHMLRNLVEEYGLSEKVCFKGYCNKIPVGDYHVGLMCSHHEAFGRVTVEYMMNNLPVVGVNSGGTSEIIEDGKTGLLSELNDIQGFYNNLCALYNDRSLCETMGKNGRERAEKYFSESYYCNNIKNIYDEIFADSLRG